MALQPSGQISLNDIATEFKVVTPFNNVALSSFYKVGVGVSKGPVAGVVKTIAANVNVPTSGQISLSNFYGAAYYYLQVEFKLTSETSSEYGGNNNGKIEVTVNGATNNYKVTVTGRTAINLTANDQTALFTGFDTGTYTINVSDNLLDPTGYTFTANIGYGAGPSSVTGYNLNQEYNIA